MMSELSAGKRTTPTVLVVDRSRENREVLRTILMRRGCRIHEANSDVTGLQIAQQCHAKVFVLDLDTVNPADEQICADFHRRAREENASVVLLGRVTKSESPLPATEVLSKPYHYGPLIRKIEELLRGAEQSV